MLHFIRERAQGWVAWFIVGLITIPFALWGVNSYMTGASDVEIASVNGEPIKQIEYQRAMERYRDGMRQQMGDRFDPSLFESADTKRALLDQLVQQKLLLAANHLLGQDVSNAAVSQVIQQTEAFQVDGQFDLQRYKSLLSRAGFSPASYEAQLKMDLLGRELSQNIQRSTIVTSTDVSRIVQLEEQQREIAYGIVKAADFTDSVVIEQDAIQAYYEEHQARYTTPEQVSVEYLELSLDNLVQTVEVDDASLAQFYEDNQGQFSRSEERRASHILIEGDDATALKILAAAQHRLAEGESFELVAKELSQDPGSATEGGDLGFIQEGMMEDEAFDAALFGLASAGDVSDIVKTEYGHHLIKVTEIKGAESKPFSDVKAGVESAYRRQEAEQLFFEQVELLAELAYENPDNLELAAEELALTIQSTPLFSREGGEGIAANPKVFNMAFGDDVLLEDLNSSVIELSNTQVVVLHKKDHQEPSQLPLDVVSEQIKQVLQAEQASAKAIEAGETILAKMNASSETSALFSEGDWHEKRLVKRSEANLDYAILEAAYSMKKPEGKTVHHGFTLSNGDYAVIALSDVKSGDVNAATEQNKAGITAYMERSLGDSELSAFLASLKADADIEISPQF